MPASIPTAKSQLKRSFIVSWAAPYASGSYLYFLLSRVGTFRPLPRAFKSDWARSEFPVTQACQVTYAGTT